MLESQKREEGIRNIQNNSIMANQSQLFIDFLDGLEDNLVHNSTNEQVINYNLVDEWLAKWLIDLGEMVIVTRYGSYWANICASWDDTIGKIYDTIWSN